jgi:hypothetical protein
MNSWKKVYQWKTSIVRFIKIRTQISVSKEATNHSKIDEEQSWLGIG